MAFNLPRLLILNQKSQQILDQRIKNNYKSQIKKGDQVPPSYYQNINSIDVVDYSNRYGFLVHCYQNDLGIKTLDHLNQQFFSTKSQFYKPLGYNFINPTIVRLSPKEQFLAVVSNKKTISILATKQLVNKKPPKYEFTLDQDIQRVQWVQQKGLLAWKFEGKIYYINFNQKEKQIVVEKPRSVQYINNTIVVVNQQYLFLFELDTLKEINKYNYAEKQIEQDVIGYFTYSQFANNIAIIKLNNLESSTFQDTDYYAWVTIFYNPDQSDEDTPCINVMYFVKGNLKQGNITIRYGQYLPTDYRGRQNYYFKKEDDSGEQPLKKPFSLKSYMLKNIQALIFCLQKSQKTYMIDLTKPFEKLCIQDFATKHQFNSTSPLLGMSIMKNFLKFQTQYQKDDQQTKNIVKNYNSSLFHIGFKQKDLLLLVPFPISIYGLDKEGTAYKYYIVNLKYQTSSDERNLKKKQQQMKKLLTHKQIIVPQALSAKNQEIINSSQPENLFSFHNNKKKIQQIPKPNLQQNLISPNLFSNNANIIQKSDQIKVFNNTNILSENKKTETLFNIFEIKSSQNNTSSSSLISSQIPKISQQKTFENSKNLFNQTNLFQKPLQSKNMQSQKITQSRPPTQIKTNQFNLLKPSTLPLSFGSLTQTKKTQVSDMFTLKSIQKSLQTPNIPPLFKLPQGNLTFKTNFSLNQNDLKKEQKKINEQKISLFGSKPSQFSNFSLNQNEGNLVKKEQKKINQKISLFGSKSSQFSSKPIQLPSNRLNESLIKGVQQSKDIKLQNKSVKKDEVKQIKIEGGNKNESKQKKSDTANPLKDLSQEIKKLYNILDESIIQLSEFINFVNKYTINSDKNIQEFTLANSKKLLDEIAEENKKQLIIPELIKKIKNEQQSLELYFAYINRTKNSNIYSNILHKINSAISKHSKLYTVYQNLIDSSLNKVDKKTLKNSQLNLNGQQKLRRIIQNYESKIRSLESIIDQKFELFKSNKITKIQYLKDIGKKKLQSKIIPNQIKLKAKKIEVERRKYHFTFSSSQEDQNFQVKSNQSKQFIRDQKNSKDIFQYLQNFKYPICSIKNMNPLIKIKKLDEQTLSKKKKEGQQEKMQKKLNLKPQKKINDIKKDVKNDIPNDQQQIPQIVPLKSQISKAESTFKSSKESKKLNLTEEKEEQSNNSKSKFTFTFKQEIRTQEKKSGVISFPSTQDLGSIQNEPKFSTNSLFPSVNKQTVESSNFPNKKEQKNKQQKKLDTKLFETGKSQNQSLFGKTNNNNLLFNKQEKKQNVSQTKQALSTKLDLFPKKDAKVSENLFGKLNINTDGLFKKQQNKSSGAQKKQSTVAQSDLQKKNQIKIGETSKIQSSLFSNLKVPDQAQKIPSLFNNLNLNNPKQNKDIKQISTKIQDNKQDNNPLFGGNLFGNKNQQNKTGLFTNKKQQKQHQKKQTKQSQNKVTGLFNKVEKKDTILLFGDSNKLPSAVVPDNQLAKQSNIQAPNNNLIASNNNPQSLFNQSQNLNSNISTNLINVNPTGTSLFNISDQNLLKNLVNPTVKPQKKFGQSSFGNPQVATSIPLTTNTSSFSQFSNLGFNQSNNPQQNSSFPQINDNKQQNSSLSFLNTNTMQNATNIQNQPNQIIGGGWNQNQNQNIFQNNQSAWGSQNSMNQAAQNQSSGWGTQNQQSGWGTMNMNQNTPNFVMNQVNNAPQANTTNSTLFKFRK